MARSYDLDPEAASRAGVSNYLTETGKYIGVLTSAYAITSDKGTEGVEVAFRTADGRSANYLSLWTVKPEGGYAYGHAILSAIMTCLRLKTISPRPMTIQTRDGSRQVDGFPDLCNKPIGLLLQREDREKPDGSMGYKFNIIAPFDAKTEQVAVEILRQLPAEKLPQMVAQLKDKPAQQRRAPAAARHGQPAGDWTQDDDIPF